MDLKIIAISFFTLLFFYSAHADTTTIVLQNGLNGYNGCEDSYTFTEDPDANHCIEPDFHLFSCIP